MKRRLSILAVAVLSSVGWGAAAEPVEGSLHLDGSAGDEDAAARGCSPNCPAVAGVRG